NCSTGFDTPFSTGIPWATANLIVDWDLDGRTDILQNNSGTLYVYRSTGTGIAAGISTGISAPSNTGIAVLDANADGEYDIGLLDLSASTLTSYLHAGANTPPDLATSFTDGFGMNQSPTYVPISQNNYTKYSDAAFPEVDYQGPLYVVNQFTASDGTGSA